MAIFRSEPSFQELRSNVHCSSLAYCKGCSVNVSMTFIVRPLLKEHGCIT